jgi:hypothetical protein
LTAIPQVPETVVPMKLIVYKSLVDPAELKQTAENMKNELFVKRFSKPRPEDIRIVSVDKYYDPYVLVDAKYRIEYFTKKVFSFEVTETAKEVKILGETFTPQMVPVVGTTPEQYRKMVNIEGQEWSFYEDKAYFILDKNGAEVLPEQVPIAPSEDNPKKILKEFGKNNDQTTLSESEVMAAAKTKIVKRPENVDTVDSEVFQVTEYVTIYNPIYKFTFRNEKTNEEKAVNIDGVTGEIVK